MTGVYREQKVRQQLDGVRLSHLCDPKSPKAKSVVLSSRVKAAISRHLVPVLAVAWERMMKPDCENHVHILAMLKALVDFYEVLKSVEQVLDIEEQVHLEDSITRTLVHYNALSTWANLSDQRHLWHQVPTFHFFMHIALASRVSNPRLSWTYNDEAFMGILKAIGESCIAGTPAHLVALKIAEKWRLGTGHRLSLAG